MSSPLSSPAPGAPRAALYGREDDLARATDLILRSDITCLTLVGPGGVGKTRLAYELARRLCSAEPPPFPDGCWTVELAGVSDPELVVPQIARAIEVYEAGEPLTLDGLAAYLTGRAALLLLDNLEHLVDAAPALGRLSTYCPELKLLVTSRRPLRIAGEQEFPVRPLAIQPEAGGEASPSVKLFFDRAKRINPHMPGDAAANAIVTDICRRVDGLPLAIELAAARTKSMSLESLRAGLGATLDLLRGGQRDAPARQQTMHAAVAWSAAQLAPADRALIQALSALSGSFTLDDALAMSGSATRSAVADGVDALIDHSLLNLDAPLAGEESRYVMLETIRAFAREELIASGGFEAARTRLAAHAALVAEAAEANLMGPEQSHWLDRIERAHANLVAGLTGAVEDADRETALRIGAALWRFWSLRGYSAEGRVWLHRALATTGDVADEVQARALRGAAHLAEDEGDLVAATKLHEASNTLWRALGNEVNLARGLSYLGCCAHDQGDFERADAYHAESLSRANSSGDARSISLALSNFGTSAFRQNDMPLAIEYWEAASDVQGFNDPTTRALFAANIGAASRHTGDIERAERMDRESLALYQSSGDRRGVAISLMNLGELRLAEGDISAADAHFTEALALFREVGMAIGGLQALVNLASIARTRDQRVPALNLIRESLDLALRQGAKVEIAELLELTAWEVSRLGGHDSSAALLGAADAIRDTTGVGNDGAIQIDRDALVRDVQTALGAGHWSTEFAAGRATPMRRAVMGAIELIDRVLPLANEVDSRRATASAASASPYRLTTRELEVLTLLVDGLSDREISEALYVSVKTVSTHVSNILGKLGVESRTAAATFAVRNGIL